MKGVLLGAVKIGVGAASILMLIIFFTVYILPVFGSPAIISNIQPATSTNITANATTLTLNVTLDNETDWENVTNVTWVFFNSTDNEVYSFINTTYQAWGTENTSKTWNTSVNINDSALPEETYYIAVAINRSSDTEAWSTTNSTSIRIDYWAPKLIAAISPTPANNSNTSYDWFEVNVTFIEKHPQNCSLDINNGTAANYSMSMTINSTGGYCYINATGQSEGTWNYSVYVNDTFARLNRSAIYFITVDLAPSVTLVSPVANYNSSSADINFTFNVTDSLASTLNCSIYINGTLNATNATTMNATSTIFSVISISEGSDQNWTINCSDDSGGTAQPTPRDFTVDTTVPTINSFSCSPSSVYTAITVTCSCNATDTTSGVETTDYATNPSTLTAGTKTTTCTATDYAGNSNSTTTSFTVNSRPGSGTPLEQLPSVSNTWDSIEPGAAVSMLINKSGLEFSQIQLEVKNKANDISITVTKLAAQPATITQTVTGNVYQYVEIERSNNINDTNIQAAAIKFKINKSWISDNNIDKNKVYLNRYANNQWNKLTTTLASEDINHVYYSAATPGFSVFVITGEIAAAQVCTPDAKRCVGDDLQTCNVNGSAWGITETCQYGCNSTSLACNPAPAAVCIPGINRCVGDNLEQCSSDGLQWTVSETCTYGCNSTALACKSAPAIEDQTLVYLAIVVIVIVTIIGIVGAKKLFSFKKVLKQ